MFRRESSEHPFKEVILLIVFPYWLGIRKKQTHTEREKMLGNNPMSGLLLVPMQRHLVVDTVDCHYTTNSDIVI